MAGRAGRRGYDRVGNVVFFDYSPERISYLTCSQLPKLRGFPAVPLSITARYATLSEHCLPANRSGIADRFSILLSNPLKGFDIESSPECVRQRNMTIRQFIFSLDLLQKRGLLNDDLIPIAASPIALVERLFYHEPANLLLSDLLLSGTLQSIAMKSSCVAEAADSIFQVLCHLFNRKFLPRGYAARILAYRQQNVPIQLPALDKDVKEILDKCNEHTMSLFMSHLKHIAKDPTRKEPMLPYSKIVLPGWKSDTLDTSGLIRSPFFTIRGLDDSFETTNEIVANAAPDLNADFNLLPISINEMTPLNSYALDFYRHGAFKTIVNTNCMKDSDAWQSLKDWSLLLACLKNCIESDETMFGKAVVFLADRFYEKFNPFCGGKVKEFSHYKAL